MSDLPGATVPAGLRVLCSGAHSYACSTAHVMRPLMCLFIRFYAVLPYSPCGGFVVARCPVRPSHMPATPEGTPKVNWSAGSGYLGYITGFLPLP